MQRVISNNDMNDPGEARLPVLDGITRKFLTAIFEALRPKDAIVITGSCVAALTLEKENHAFFLPGDIDVFVKQNLKLEDEIFDRYYLLTHILRPLSQVESIDWQPAEIPIKEGLHPERKKYGNCRLHILDIMEFTLLHPDGKDLPVNRPKIQIIVVADDSPTPPELPSFCLTPFERKVVTSFDFDIVQGAYNPGSDHVTFAYTDTKENILRMQFWYICNSKRSFNLPSAIQRIKKYRDRGFTLLGFRDLLHPRLAISLVQFRIFEPPPFERDSDPDEDDNGLDL
jgi:hypothetical protein